MSSQPSPHPIPSTSRLCDICSKLPLDAEDPPFGNDPDEKDDWSLGTLDRIRGRTDCPLCRLVFLATYEVQRGWSGLLNQDITIEWQGGMGAGEFQLAGPGWSGFGTTIRFVNESIGQKPARGSKIYSSKIYSFLPIADSQLDISRARSWISACEHNHGETCNPRWSQSIGSSFSGLEVLRLLDVVNECLVEVRSPCRYLILSYVWGGVNNVRLTSSNKSSMMKEGVLQTIWRILPRTVQDAIDIVKALGERFLWVDALCLVQNDAVDVRIGIEVMDLIYERAALCIIAVSGDSANAGLPGVRCGSRLVTNHVEQIRPGIKLAVYNELDHMLRPSAYNRRAWT
jgi:hypothetical protein